MKSKNKLGFNSLVLGLVAALVASERVRAVQPSAAMGQGLYEQQGSNSCSFCHGLQGEGGKVAAAAKLTHPKSWKSYKAIGGDAAFKANRAEFLKNLEEAVVDVIAKGAIAHNSSFKRPWHDFKKAGGTINAQMLGLGGAPSAAWLKRFADRGVTKEIAAKSVYLYIQKFDQDGVFK